MTQCGFFEKLNKDVYLQHPTADWSGQLAGVDFNKGIGSTCYQHQITACLAAGCTVYEPEPPINYSTYANQEYLAQVAGIRYWYKALTASEWTAAQASGYLPRSGKNPAQWTEIAEGMPESSKSHRENGNGAWIHEGISVRLRVEYTVKEGDRISQAEGYGTQIRTLNLIPISACTVLP